MCHNLCCVFRLQCFRIAANNRIIIAYLIVPITIQTLQLTEQGIDNQVRLLLSRSEQFLTVKLLNFISEGTIMKQTLRKKKTMLHTFEPRREKTNILHMGKQRRRSASR